MSKKHYAERDVIEQGDYYIAHVSAMTREGLHSKSDIAAELAHRDMIIDDLYRQIAALRTAAKRKRDEDLKRLRRPAKCPPKGMF